jgi:undecaprenyl-diphosphatase
MGLLEVVISGIVQGVAEFLPISSSGHLVVLHKLTGSSEPEILFDLFLHLGTLAAVFIVFGRDIVESVTTKKRTGIEAAFSNVRTVGIMFIVTGVWLIAGNFIRFGTEGMTAFKAGLIGLAQGIAALPGISRSGATISTGLFLGLDGQDSAKFSFLLSIPAILGAFLFKVKESGLNLSGINIKYFIGFFIACIAGVLSLKLLLKVLYRNKFHWFGIYCILAGITVILFLKP